LFGKRQRAEKIKQTQDVIHNVLMTQLVLGSAFASPESQRRLLTPYGCGYIFGFADSLIALAGVTEEVEVMAELTVAHLRIFGEDQGAMIFGKSLTLQGDAEFMAARMAGGNESRRWLSDKQFVPMGLSRYLNGHTVSPPQTDAIRMPDPKTPPPKPPEPVCDWCKGQGTRNGKPCPVCGGRIRVPD
jgi:hypothetical protein